MALITQQTLRDARDEFERYYTEKIWEWIPGIYRHEDGLAVNEDVLRSIVEILARQAAVARRSIDRLWEDQFIDFCDDWAISYIGDLIGARLVHELNRRGRRTDVAKTIFYRRRKGTPVVMEALIRDITGWEGAVVESFRRLSRTRHGLDPEPHTSIGAVSLSPPGGFAKLNNTRISELLDGPFDEFSHAADFRQLRGFKGRYNIPKLNFHLYRLRAFEVSLATPFDLGNRRFTLNPSGRDVEIFRPAQRPGEEQWSPVVEWQLPAAIPCRLLGAAHYRLVIAGLPAGLQATLAGLSGELFISEARLRETLLTAIVSADLDANISTILIDSITGDSPKLHLIPNAVSILVGADSGEAPFGHETMLSGNLDDWGASLMPAADKEVVIDPLRGRVLLLADPAAGDRLFVPTYHYGFSGDVGAGTYDRQDSTVTDGVTDFPGGAQAGDGDELEPGPITGFTLPDDGDHQFTNSKTYEPDMSPDNTVVDVDHLCLQARNPERPYVRLIPVDAADQVTFSALSKPSPVDPENDAHRRLLSMEGLWIGIVPTTVVPETLADTEQSCTPVVTRLVLDGIFDRVEIRHSTLDPGGEQARVDPLQCTPIPVVELEIRGQIEELIIDGSILGPIREAVTGSDPCSVGKIIIRDSIVQSIVGGVPAIETSIGAVHLERTTVFGDVSVNRLFASEALIQGAVRVTDNQHGCFRFSAANNTPTKRMPPSFESHLFGPAIPNHFFQSRRFGDPGFAQLSDSAPVTVVRGGENRSEMGVFNNLLNPIKRDDLRTKVNEYMPFGLIAQYINET